MPMTVREIADLVGAKVEGKGDIPVKGASGIKEAEKGDITFLANSKYLPLMKETKAAAIIVPPGVEVPKGKTAIIHESPSLAFAMVMQEFGAEEVSYGPGIHSTAVIGKGVRLGEGVSIQPYAVIEDDVSIGDNVTVCAGVFIGRKTDIGQGTFIFPRVVVRERIIIGKDCIIHSGAVIGSDGFGYATVKGVHHKIPQIGTVVIEDNVEIGANVTIDRARIDKTLVKKGTKIDNLVQIAHNVTIGENSIVVAQTGISGSTKIGKNVILAGQSGITGHISIGDEAIVGAQAGVTKSVPPGQIVSGYPAAPHTRAKKIQAFINRLPGLYERVAAIERGEGQK